MSHKALLEQALLMREVSEFGGTVNYHAANYPCSLGAMTHEARMGEGGFSLSKQTVIVIRKAVLPGVDANGVTTLKPGQALTVTDKRGTVRSLKIAPDGVNDLIYLWELTLQDPAQRT